MQTTDTTDTLDATLEANDLPVPAGHIRLTNREIERIWSALTELSKRRLVGPENEKKVFVLLRRYFEAPFRVYEDLKNKVFRDEYPLPQDGEDTDIPAWLREARVMAVEDRLNQTQDIPSVPEHLMLTEADMPKPLKGEMGDANRTAITDIKHRLGFLYQLDDDDEE